MQAEILEIQLKHWQTLGEKRPEPPWCAQLLILFLLFVSQPLLQSKALRTILILLNQQLSRS